MGSGAFTVVKKDFGMKLSILICHLPERKPLLDRLMDILTPQLSNEVQVLIHESKGMTIGEKRNYLLKLAKGDYVAFCDDDDKVSDNYVKLLTEGIDKGVDCCSLMGEYTINGVFDGYFEHSIKYNAYRTVSRTNVKYERYPNHLNCIKSSIAKQFKFPEKNHGEDTDWATQIHKSGLIKTEHYIPQVIYHYEYRSKN